MYNILYHSQNISNCNFLVTGGAGFIGSNIVEYLLKYSAGKVKVLDNFSTGSFANIKEFMCNPAFELIEGDIRDLETCRKALEGIDYVSHQAALGSVPRSINDPITSNEVNVSGFINMLLAARDAGVKRMVYAASSSTYGDHPGLPKVEDKIGKPLSPYAITKYVNELYGEVFSKTYSFHTIGLRYFNVFGPKQNPRGPYAAVIPLFIEAALKGEAPFINGDGETSRDFTFVENAVQANVKALLATNITQHEVINIAFGERTTLNQLWNKISEITKTNVLAQYCEERKGDVKHSLANIDKAASLIGYKPVFSMKDGLIPSLKWYQSIFLK
ncbi:SDR family oxidoreductase [Pontibacter sp. BT310]|uniref:SDR family oxidoreductase n=1 Tax=Pontibacter populi TaxID=890055 RepID=A0ABS6XDJ7_9BACT|nr:SDR family oxidoreductase [Pontibacter populi]MBJ6119201.1 SDR family oxidoreductase [Pontibacter sp. BT310]MBR0571629.1 SDR family oxidoreductase [Microvirga sp. STS03]MBW3366055.1 SDR family oxidoreductase [Pontibacter populi]